jgi:lipoprotein NlpI
MQYGRKAFSSNNQDTMQSITDPNMYLGGDYMTNQDVTELNTLYDCRSKSSISVIFILY